VCQIFVSPCILELLPHTLFVTYALRGVTSQQQNRLWRSHATESETANLKMSSAKTRTQLINI